VIISRVRIPTQTAQGWPFTLALVRQIADEGLAFVRPVTFLVGENGSGKSTLIEAIAEAYGVDVRGGHTGRRYNNAPAKGPLGQAIELVRTSVGSRMTGRRTQGFFLRAETALGVFEFMSDYGVAGYGDKHLAKVSHGEGFLRVLAGRFVGPGLYLMDEPEAALSFSSCLQLVAALDQLGKDGGQVICATHSPVLCALPGAQILELTDEGIQPREWEDLTLVNHWRQFMSEPNSYIRYVVE
jgi:predicted ATPase